MAAEDAVLRLGVEQTVLLGDDAYGGTFRLIDKVHGPVGTRLVAADLTDADRVARQWPDGTTTVWIETPTNPGLRIVDIEAVAALAHARGATVVVDNTFATPYLQRPLELGADIVVHSSTKYLGGHSDVVGGIAATDDDGVAERLRFLQNAVGAVPSPFDCFLAHRGLKTLALRMDRHCANARAVAEFLAGHPAVDRVLWPGLPGHPGHEVAARQMRDFGGMVSFVLAGGEAAALEVVGRDPPVHVGRVARRGRVAHRAPGPDDARVGRRLRPGGRPGPGPAVGGGRDGGRSGGRSGSGPQALLLSSVSFM